MRCPVFTFQNGLWNLVYKHALGLNGPKARQNDQLEVLWWVLKKEDYRENFGFFKNPVTLREYDFVLIPGTKYGAASGCPQSLWWSRVLGGAWVLPAAHSLCLEFWGLVRWYKCENPERTYGGYCCLCCCRPCCCWSLLRCCSCWTAVLLFCWLTGCRYPDNGDRMYPARNLMPLFSRKLSKEIHTPPPPFPSNLFFLLPSAG